MTSFQLNKKCFFFFFVVSVLFNPLGGEGEVIALIDVGEESALWYYSSRKLVKLLIWCFWLFLVVSQQREKVLGWLGGSLRGFPCVFMATVAILELLAHLVWKAEGVTNNKSTNYTTLDSTPWQILLVGKYFEPFKSASTWPLISAVFGGAERVLP